MAGFVHLNGSTKLSGLFSLSFSFDVAQVEFALRERENKGRRM